MPEDAAAVIALAEEERDACPACGLPKVWCRDPANQFVFDAQVDTCWPTWAISEKRQTFEKAHASTQRALQLSAGFRKGHRPDVAAGLGLDATATDVN